MKLSRSVFLAFSLCALLPGCAAPGTNTGANTTANTSSATATPAAQNLTVAGRPQSIVQQMSQRGQQDEASPVLKIVQPAEGATVNGSVVRVKLDLGGDLKGYKPGREPGATMGNHIHVILDNQPYEAYYHLDQPFELRNVSEGPHVLRVFASRPWHESYKNEGSFQMVSFTVKGGGDPSQPTTTGGGAKMADSRNATAANTNAANTNAANVNAANAGAANASGASPNAAATPEGKEMQPGTAPGNIDRTKPLLTYSRPKGEYKGEDANNIMIDFWLTNAKLEKQGGEYRVRYSVDGGTPQYIDSWEPIWLTGWTAGEHQIKLELVNRDDAVVDNGGFNMTTRKITVVK